MRRILVTISMLAFAFLSTPALAAKLAVVDFQAAINEVKEGKKAKADLDSMFSSKRKALAKQEESLKAQFKQYEKQAAVLSATARKQKESELMQGQMQLQQLAQQSEVEFRKAYDERMAGLIKKVKTICDKIGKEKGYDMIIEKNAGVVFHSANVKDITKLVISRYDKSHGK